MPGIIGKIISLIETETQKKCLPTNRYQLDWERSSVIEYDCLEKNQQQQARKKGETGSFSGPRSIEAFADHWKNLEPVFRFFLDGSRRTYRIADIPIDEQYYPILAGQVGVGVCERNERHFKIGNDFEMHYVLSVSERLDTDGKTEKSFNAYFGNLRDKINGQAINSFKLNKILHYTANKDDNCEDKAIETIQNYMIEREKETVKNLVDKSLLNDESWLIKDGSLEYVDIKNQGDEFYFNKIRKNYKHIVGVSKSFNPSLAVLKNGRNASKMIADLKPYERTPAFFYKTDRVDASFAVWYLRIRDTFKNNRSPFDGVVKIEKVLVTKDEIENGLDTALVDKISAWVINERTPVCYGRDNRWANHLYPIFVTEQFIKSRYMSTEHFTNLF